MSRTAGRWRWGTVHCQTPSGCGAAASHIHESRGTGRTGVPGAGSAALGACRCISLCRPLCQPETCRRLRPASAPLYACTHQLTGPETPLPWTEQDSDQRHSSSSVEVPSLPVWNLQGPPGCGSAGAAPCDCKGSLLRSPKAPNTRQGGRRGAGREAPGVAYRLYTEAAFEGLAAETVPEIKRCNLASVVLQVPPHHLTCPSPLPRGALVVNSSSKLGLLILL